MNTLLVPGVSILEKIIRPIIVYLFLLGAFRFMGKREVGQLTPFDLVVFLIISNVVQNSMVGRDDSLTGGLIGAAAILGINYVVTLITYRFRGARNMLELSPVVLIHNGVVYHKNLEKEKITMDELLEALRLQGVSTPSRVRVAMLERNGAISVIPMDSKSKN